MEIHMLAYRHPCIPEKSFVWATTFSKGLIGLFFQRQTIKHFLGIPRQFVGVQNALEDHEETPWFMQDDDRPHRMAEAFHFLNEHFDDRVISHNYCKRTGSGLNWPTYFPGFTPCDFFLWDTWGTEYPPKCANEYRTEIVHLCCIWDHFVYNVTEFVSQIAPYCCCK